MQGARQLRSPDIPAYIWRRRSDASRAAYRTPAYLLAEGRYSAMHCRDIAVRGRQRESRRWALLA